MIIHIKNLRAQTLLGCFPEERAALREVVLNLTIEYDHAKSLISDNVADVPDYGVIEQTIVDLLAKQEFHLLESLAALVMKTLLAFNGVRQVTVEIDKAGTLKYADSVSVTHTQSND